MAFASLNTENLDSTEYLRIATPYVGARALVAGRTVLDIGSGPGYGAYLLASGNPTSMVVCDVDHARLPSATARNIIGHRTSYGLVDAEALPFRNHVVSVVTLFEVIEHVPRPKAVLRELHRVLDDAGVVVMSTPNRAVRLLPFERPWNAEHLVEYSISSFRTVVGEVFPFVRLLGVYGVGPFHAQYLRRWHPTLRRWVRQDVRPRLGATQAGRRVKQRLRRAESAPQVSAPTPSEQSIKAAQITQPAATEWPFIIRDQTNNCLSTVAVCGRQAESVRTAARALVAAYGRNGSEDFADTR